MYKIVIPILLFVVGASEIVFSKYIVNFIVGFYLKTGFGKQVKGRKFLGAYILIYAQGFILVYMGIVSAIYYFRH